MSRSPRLALPWHNRSVRNLLTGVVAALIAVWIPTLGAQPPAAAPAFTSSGQLVRPADYREWVYVSSGLGMTYGPAQPASGRPPMFDNVFVTRDAYAEFLRSGSWPDKTMFVLEIRQALSNVSINNGGHTQGDLVALEAAVKDRQRFPDGGWAYFDLGAGAAPPASAAPLARTASCYACHSANTASDNTFVQFYPTLFEAATRFGTIKPGFDRTTRP